MKKYIKWYVLNILLVIIAALPFGFFYVIKYSESKCIKALENKD